MGVVIDQDLNDADKKIGKKTLYETVSIIGSWGGGFAGAKAGAVAGLEQRLELWQVLE